MSDFKIENFYIREIVQGLWITSKHFFKNLFLHTLHLFGLAKDKEAAVTISYPEQRRRIPPVSRTVHRLAKREDGSLKCVACMMCATACPSDCINIVAGEYPDPKVEKYPVKFEIDEGRCVFCGFCVEACPEAAIFMDTAIVEFDGYYSLDKLIYDIPKLSSLEPASVTGKDKEVR